MPLLHYLLLIEDNPNIRNTAQLFIRFAVRTQHLLTSLLHEIYKHEVIIKGKVSCCPQACTILECSDRVE